MASVEPSQLKQLSQIFNRFDMDSNGSLTHLELAALLRSLGLKPRGDKLNALLAAIDANANGLVEFDVLLAAILPADDSAAAREVLLNQEQLLEVFRAFDIDGNGFVTAELAEAIARMGRPLTYKELSEMIREADSNGDGVLSFLEFATGMAHSAADFLDLSFA